MIPNKRYIVQLQPDQIHTLTPEHVEIATCLDCTSGKLLVFRDNFIAYKVATLTGGTVCLGQIVDAACDGALALGDGTLLVLEPPVPA